MAGDLRSILEDGQRQGFLGPGRVTDHIEHAAAFVAAVAPTPATALDLGSGSGVPGLVLATTWTDARLVLLDAQLRRVAFLEAAVERLGLGDRVGVVHGRAEDLGREPAHRGRYDVVTARSFGPPAVTAECGAPFLRVGGLLVVAEPPDAPSSRWPAAGLAELGLADDGVVAEGSARVRRLRATSTCPDRFPRRPGVPAKRPLFS